MNQFQKSCKAVLETAGITDYAHLDITTVANNYCAALDSGDEKAREINFAILALRFWKQMINYFRKTGPIISEVTYDDLPSIFLARLNRACQYRAWLDPTKKTNAQACINQAISTQVAIDRQQSNFDKNRANYNTSRLDAAVSTDSDDNEKTLGEILPSDYGISGTGVTLNAWNNSYAAGSGVAKMVKSLIADNLLQEAVIADIIGFEDSVKRTKETTVTTNEDGTTEKTVQAYIEPSEFRVVQNLKVLPEDYEDSFRRRYSVSDPALAAVITSIRNSNPRKLHKYYTRTKEVMLSRVSLILQ